VKFELRPQKRKVFYCKL